MQMHGPHRMENKKIAAADSAAAGSEEIFAAMFHKHCFVSAKYKICYTAVNKAASTSLKNWFVDIEGIRDAIEARRITIARRETRKHNGDISFEEILNEVTFLEAMPKIAPWICEHSFEEAEALFATEGYFRFAVVRNPYTRIFSAWADKILQEKYIYSMAHFHKADFYYQPVTTITALIKNFEDFLVYLKENGNTVFLDRHWAPQTFVVRPDRIAYDLVAKLEEPEELNRVMAERLGPDEPLPLKSKLNTSPLAFRPEFLSARAQGLMLDLYAADFSVLGYDTNPPAATGAFDPAATEEELRRGLSERLRRLVKRNRMCEGRVRYLKNRNHLEEIRYNLGNHLTKFFDRKRL